MNLRMPGFASERTSNHLMDNEPLPIGNVQRMAGLIDLRERTEAKDAFLRHEAQEPSHGAATSQMDTVISPCTDHPVGLLRNRLDVLIVARPNRIGSRVQGRRIGTPQCEEIRDD